MDRAPDDVASGIYLNNLTSGMVLRIIEESMKYINHIEYQLEIKDMPER